MVTGNFGDGVKPSVFLRIERGRAEGGGGVDPPIDLSMLGFESEPRVQNANPFHPGN